MLPIALIWAGLVVRLVMVFHHAVDTDEPQHLHVAWAWTRGLLVYRDVFDNHSPLFSLAFAPLLSAIGERPDIVLLMRIAVIPVAALALAMLWVVARRLFGAPAAAWAVAIAAVYPDFIQKSVEYRADDLWTALWMCTLAVLLTGRLSRGRLLAVGLLLGATFGASMKTSLLVSALGFALLGTLVLLAARGVRPPPRRLLSAAGWASCGVVVVPALILAFFGAQHALEPFLYCTIRHNLVPRMGQWGARPWLPLVLIPSLPVVAWVAKRVLDSSLDTRVALRRTVLFLTAAIYWLGVKLFWPLVTRQDWLPVVPMLAALASAVLLELPRVARERFAVAPILVRALKAVPALAVIAELVTVSVSEPLWIDRTQSQRQALGEVLRLTAPGDPVMDLRGEAIFRNRPYYYVLEDVMETRLQMGLVRDSIPEHLISTRTPIASIDFRDFPPRARAFLNEHYLTVGWWRVVGCMVEPAPALPRAEQSFELPIGQRYAVVTPQGPARGWLDGSACEGARELAPGTHRYRATAGEQRVAVVWAQAVERGFSPFGSVSAAR